jgi:ABC-type transporter Mla MlaB component
VTPRGVVRLLNTSGGRVLCLAGEVDEGTVEAFLERYGREPARIDRIDAGSVTALSPPGLALLRDHLEAARWAGRPVTVSCAPLVERLLADSVGVGPGPDDGDVEREVEGKAAEQQAPGRGR